MSQIEDRRPRKVLITASAAFAGLRRSAPEEVVTRLRAEAFERAELTISVLPVDFHAIPVIVSESIVSLRPDIVLGLGTEIGAPAVRLETTAMNLADSSIADNRGNLIRGQIPFPGKPHALAGTWPAASLVAQLHSHGIPAHVSHHAGAHLCNLTYYAMLDAIAQSGCSSLCGYAHLPLLPEQVADLIGERLQIPEKAPPANVYLPSMSLDLELRAVCNVLNGLLSICARG